MEERTIRAAALGKYLVVSYSTMDTWFKNGLLGDKFMNLGRGQFREFSFKDVCAARIVQEVLNATRSIDIAKKAVDSFRKLNEKSLKEQHLELLITFKGPHISIGLSHVGREEQTSKVKSSSGYTAIFIPVAKIMENVANTFPELIEVDI